MCSEQAQKACLRNDLKSKSLKRLHEAHLHDEE